MSWSSTVEMVRCAGICVADHMSTGHVIPRIKLGDPETCERWQQQLIKATKPPDAVNKLFAFKHCAYCKDMDCHNPHGNCHKGVICEGQEFEA